MKPRPNPEHLYCTNVTTAYTNWGQDLLSVDSMKRT